MEELVLSSFHYISLGKLITLKFLEDSDSLNYKRKKPFFEQQGGWVVPTMNCMGRLRLKGRGVPFSG